MAIQKRNESKERIERLEVVRLYKEGFTLREIQEQTGLSKSRVSYIIYCREKVEKKQGLPRVDRKVRALNTETIQRINKLVEWGYKPNEISEDVSVPTSLVHQVVMNLEASNMIQKRV